MSWNLVFASQPGTSHLRSGGGCQDESGGTTVTTGSGHLLLGLFVSDGAGSAAAGGRGAETAVVASLAFVEQLSGSDVVLDDQLGKALVATAREAVADQAYRTKRPVRDFACTYLGLLSLEGHGTVLVHLGDGGIVVDLGDGFECRTAPMNGEYANSTRFVTDDDALEQAQVVTVGRPVSRAALFSDGLQSLAVNQAANVPHEPFFRPFFAALAAAPAPTPDDEHPLQGALSRVLNGEDVNRRTDDDKSLAIAMWCLGDADLERLGG